MHTHLGTQGSTHATASAWRCGAVSFIATIALVLGATAAHAQAPYVALDLGTLGGTSVDSSDAQGINNRGDIVGSSSINGQSHAFLWTASGGMRDLGTLGGANSLATAINDSGTVVGWAQNAAGVTRAFLWTERGGMVDLGTLGGAASEAWGINNSGQVAGVAQIATGQNRGFRWSSSGGMVNLGTMGGPSSRANGINDAGVVSCNGQTLNFDTYPCWGPANALNQLFGTVPPAALAGAFAINNLGQIVGADPSGAIWWPSPGTAPSGTRIAAPGTPSDINDSGQVAGNTGTGRAFVWSPSAGSVFLVGDSSSASEINNTGTVVGSRIVNGQLVATRWTPGGGPVTGVTLTTDLASPQPGGTRIQLTGAATGGTSPVSYRFWLQPWATGVWQVLQDWSTTATVSWTPTTQGGYNLAVEARRAGSTAGEAQSAIGYTISSGSGGGGGGGGTMTGITLSTNPTDPQPRGTTIVLSGTGAGGTAPYSYRFWVQPWSGDWQVIRDWGLTASASWTPTVAGGYNIAVEGRSSGASNAQVSASNTYVITPSGGGVGGGGGLMTAVTLAASAFWPQPLGTTVTWTATGQGGTAPYSFRFWVQPWNGAWQVVRDWSTSASFVWRPTAAGGYNVAVEARSAGATAKEVQKAEVFVIAAP